MRRRRRQGWRRGWLFRGKGHGYLSRSWRCVHVLACWCACLLPTLVVPGVVRLSALPAQYEPVLTISPPGTSQEGCLLQRPESKTSYRGAVLPRVRPPPPLPPSGCACYHRACMCLTAPKYPAVKDTWKWGRARCLESANRIRTRDGNCGGWGRALGVKCGDRREPLHRPFSPGGLSDASTAPKPLPAFTCL